MAKNGKTPNGVYVGRFYAEDLKKGRDKQAVEAKKKETGLKYVNSRPSSKWIDIWVCSLEDCESFK